MQGQLRRLQVGLQTQLQVFAKFHKPPSRGSVAAGFLRPQRGLRGLALELVVEPSTQGLERLEPCSLGSLRQSSWV